MLILYPLVCRIHHINNFFVFSSRPEQPKLLDALFGKAKFYLNRFNFSNSLEVLNQAVAGYPDFLPALIEKMKAQLALQDWDQAMETAHRYTCSYCGCMAAYWHLSLISDDSQILMSHVLKNIAKRRAMSHCHCVS